MHKTADLRTPYWDWTEREGTEHYRKYAGTAPVHLLFALRQAIDMLFEEGLENAFRRHRLLGEAVRRAVAAWAEGQVLGFNIAEPSERSNTVTTVTMIDGHDPAALQRYCKDKCGVVLGTGIGDLAGPGVPHRPYGPCQRADDARHAGRDRGRPQCAEDPARQGRARSRGRVSRRAGGGLDALSSFSPCGRRWRRRPSAAVLRNAEAKLRLWRRMRGCLGELNCEMTRG